jgi:GxxExxY protein
LYENNRKVHKVFSQSKKEKMTENEISKIIIGLAIQVHRSLGPGLLENAYKECLFYKINQYGLFVEKEKVLPLIFEEVKLDCGYRVDLLVENKFIIELKSVESLSEIHLAQTLTYLKLGNYKLGLLINFNEVLLKNGIRRVVNNL